MSIDSIYGSTYLSAATVKSEGLKGKVFTIYDVRVETFREDQDKVVLSFQDYLKELPLNKTNAKLLAEEFGDDEKLWKGRKIKIGLTKRMFKGELVDAIAVAPMEESS